MDQSAMGSEISHVEAEFRALQDIQLSPLLESRLELLVQAAEALGLDEPSTTSFNRSIIQLSSRRLNLKLSLNRATYVEEELRIHLAKLEAELALLRKWSASLNEATSMSEPTVGTETETAEILERRRTVIIRKAKEYQAQLSRLNSTASSSSTDVTISDLARIQEQNKDREKEIRRKRKKVEAFRGLPANPELARLNLLQATQKLQDLTRVRERLLGRMIDD
ncbi:hypothetical protein GGU10DRAFT_365474 [Lentinula aff. detonsa]|uniref:Uncharacterized protein n=1 Tax=Lentinula aff. detonsa TaxID=2804958 RepID=A0AA38KCJ1_9AGAR|nr:hypothetical protein GGU10DRAFT_365474 [Lentinula aff. detonsa]